MNFRLTGMYVLSFISKTLHSFSNGFFPMYRGILELKNDTIILRKKWLILKQDVMRFGGTVSKNGNLLLLCNFVNKQIKKNF